MWTLHRKYDLRKNTGGISIGKRVEPKRVMKYPKPLKKLPEYRDLVRDDDARRLGFMNRFFFP